MSLSFVLLLLLAVQDLPPQPAHVPLIPAGVKLDLGGGHELALNYRTMGFSEDLAERARRIQGPERIAAEAMLGYRWDARLVTPVRLHIGTSTLEPGTHRLLLWYGEGGEIELVVLAGRRRLVLHPRCYRSPLRAPAISCGLTVAGAGQLELLVHFGPTLAVLEVAMEQGGVGPEHRPERGGTERKDRRGRMGEIEWIGPRSDRVL